LAADLTQYLPGEAIQAVYFFKVKGKCPPPLELDPSAEPYTIGYWKNNLIKLLDGRKGTQVASMALLKTYLTRINAFASSVFNAAELPDLQKAYEVLSAHGPEPVVLLKKQLLAAEFNYMNGAYYESPEKTAEKIIFAEELILKYLAANPTVTDADLLAQKDLFDAFNNLDLVILP
jgi:hypothetical protein